VWERHADGLYYGPSLDDASPDLEILRTSGAIGQTSVSRGDYRYFLLNPQIERYEDIRRPVQQFQAQPVGPGTPRTPSGQPLPTEGKAFYEYMGFRKMVTPQIEEVFRTQQEMFTKNVVNYGRLSREVAALRKRWDDHPREFTAFLRRAEQGKQRMNVFDQHALRSFSHDWGKILTAAWQAGTLTEDELMSMCGISCPCTGWLKVQDQKRAAFSDSNKSNPLRLGWGNDC